MMVKSNDSQGQGRPCPWPDNFWFVFVCLFVFKVGVKPEILKKKKIESAVTFKLQAYTVFECLFSLISAPQLSHVRAQGYHTSA